VTISDWCAVHAGPARPRTIIYEAPDPGELERARERRVKELKMYDILREIFFYVVYVWVVIVLSYEFRDPNAFQFRENLRSAFVTGGRSGVSSSETNLELVNQSHLFLVHCYTCCIATMTNVLNCSRGISRWRPTPDLQC